MYIEAVPNRRSPPAVLLREGARVLGPASRLANAELAAATQYASE
jgi:hypothetical protein